MKSKLFSDTSFNKNLWRLTLPIAIQHLMLAMVAAADAFMLGGLDQNTMSAVSLATQVQFVQNMIVSSVVTASVILGAQYWGKQDKNAIDDIFGIALRLSGLIPIATCIGCVCFPRQLMLLFTPDEELIQIGIRYLKITGLSYLITGISQCYIALMKISEHTSDVARISVCTVLLNIVLNAVLIFGLLGAPRMMEQGAALATLIARVIELGWAVLMSHKKGYIRPKLVKLFTFNKVLEKDFIRVVMPLIGAYLLWGVGFTSYTAFMGHLGTDAAAGNSVASVVRDLLCCTCDGLASGGGILVGNELGAGRLEKGREYGDKLLKISFLCGFVCTAAMLLVTFPLMSFVKLTDGARGLLWGMMIIMAFYMIGRCVNTIVINGVFAAGGDTMFDFETLIIFMWLIAVPLAALGTFVFHWHPLLVYACTCLDEVGKIPWVVGHFKKYKWVKDLTREKIA